MPDTALQAWLEGLLDPLRAWADELGTQGPVIAGALAPAHYRGPAADRDRAILRELATRTDALARDLETVWAGVAGLVHRLEGRR